MLFPIPFPAYVHGDYRCHACGIYEAASAYPGGAVELPSKGGAGKFEKMTIPAATWAVFDCTLDNLQEVTKRIFSEWFPSTGYEHDPKPELEIYLPEDPRSKVMHCQIWIPIVKKKKK
jgi:predicted transcriptional regulator YdeE